jgi:hypothetical protein
VGFEFHPDQWLDLLTHYPVVVVLLCGQVGGISFTQLVKKNYLDWSQRPDTPPRVPDGRYRASVRTLSAVATFGFTQVLWIMVIQVHNTGLHWVAAVIAGVTSPWVYTGAHAAVRWKFPEFAKRWGDDRVD